MKTLSKKTFLAAAMTTALAVTSTSAMAIVYNPFDVTETSVPGTIANVITDAGKITGGYNEIATFSNQVVNPGVSVSGTFTADLKWAAGQFYDTTGNGLLTSQLGTLGSNTYGLYGLFSGLTGTFVTDLATGKTSLTFLPGGSMSIFIDPSSNTAFTGGSVTPTGNTSDDYLIATGTGQSGQGLLDPTLSTCNTNNNCGSFGFQNTFILTTVASAGVPGATPGTAYFSKPIPFYNISFEGGQFNNFDPTSTQPQNVNGSLDAGFKSVPEPTNLALIGISLLGLGLHRRKQA